MVGKQTAARCERTRLAPAIAVVEDADDEAVAKLHAGDAEQAAFPCKNTRDRLDIPRAARDSGKLVPLLRGPAGTKCQTEIPPAIRFDVVQWKYPVATVGIGFAVRSKGLFSDAAEPWSERDRR